MMIDFKEIWKSIKGYEQLYEISNLGNVKSKNDIPVSEQYGISDRDFI